MAEKFDANDRARRYGSDDVRRDFDENARAYGPEPPNGARGAPRFPVISIDHIDVDAQPVWLIKDLLPATGIGVVFGLPKSGKSFVLADALFHVAMGRAWAGRDVLDGAVVYVSSEGKGGLRRRFVAMRRHYGVEGQRLPFGFISVMPDLGHMNGDADALIASIREWLAENGDPPLRAIAIDTLARAMQGADENAAKDMGALVANAEAIAGALGSLVLLVHHAGRAADARSRGSNALDGAADVMWHCEKVATVSRVTIHAMKDAEAGLEWTFRLKPYWLDRADAAQENACTCVVEIVAAPRPTQQADKPGRLSPTATAGLRALHACLDEQGKVPAYCEHIPQDAACVTLDQWRDYLSNLGIINKDGSYREQFRRIRVTLKNAGLIGIWGEHVWAV